VRDSGCGRGGAMEEILLSLLPFTYCYYVAGNLSRICAHAIRHVCEETMRAACALRFTGAARSDWMSAIGDPLSDLSGWRFPGNRREFFPNYALYTSKKPFQSVIKIIATDCDREHAFPEK